MKARRRQWGTERSTVPLPAFHPRPGVGALVRARLALWLTVALWLVYLIAAVITIVRGGAGADVWQVLMTLSYVVVISALTFSSAMYLLARSGAIARFNAHVRTPRRRLDEFFSREHPALTVLIPSFAEDPELVRKALLSAALQEYPELRVAVLIDDDPETEDTEARARLEHTRALPDEIERLLSGPAEHAHRAWRAHLRAIESGEATTSAEWTRVADAYESAATWVRLTAAEEPRENNIDVFLSDTVLGTLAADLQATADAAAQAAVSESAPDLERATQLLRRLVWIFSVRVSLFERKRYASLSHEPNKAMNLNAYLALMGGRYDEVATAHGTVLVPASPDEKASVEIPAADYVLTLDADSILLPEYAVRLVYHLEQPENARAAVAQTPYSSFRGAPTRLARLASATTDVQHVIHQGLSAYDAAFWVGANAVIRRAALDDVRVVEQRDGLEVEVFVRDSTVIEDTASSIGLLAHGWSLYNYPERLSYSATPEDYGALVVQRRRWANGGLLVVPWFFSIVRARRHSDAPMRLSSVLLRLNYLASIAWASAGLVFLMLAFFLEDRVVTPWMFLIAIPYFASMAADLRSAGYHRRDIVGVYGLNLLLLAANLSGMIASIRQALTGIKSPFVRTPKSARRTVATIPSIIVPVAIVAVSTATVWRAVTVEAWSTVLFAGINAVTAAAALILLVGLGNAVVDVWLRWTDWLWVTPRRVPSAESSAPDWQRTLDEGELSAPHRAGRAHRAATTPSSAPEKVAA